MEVTLTLPMPATAPAACWTRAAPHVACQARAPHLYKAAAGVAADVRVVGLRQMPVERRRVKLRAQRPVIGARRVSPYSS